MLKLFKGHILSLFFILILTMSVRSVNAYDNFEKHVESIHKMVAAGILNEQEANEQIGQLRMEIAENDDEEEHEESEPRRGVASTLTEQKIIKFSNQAIEIQVK